ncbi:cell division protein ZapE [Saccharobesus litoralis]|uniref:Cell division protein ZapE n=1 Tax=Saccharobesus litoralis TaxID=2172099 RepID=A0A2S0VWS3_9ALTE|nr:cell division protein ZapE [Saccharobesus litoralis]AWB68635.1 cell division protein ZapE [Saccharobesus litoralis]
MSAKKTPLACYQADLQRADFHHDPAQENAINHLQRLYDDLVAQDQVSSSSFFSKLKAKFVKPPQQAVKGLYFWGGVGRGKTYLVDTFFECLPFNNKMRVHFHRFMHRVHDELKLLKNVADPLDIIAAKFAKEAKIICFDEFFVSDITDAMLLGGLFEKLFKLDVVLVATSNIVPDELYRNGLQRARFLPAIDLINQNCEVVNVDHGVDYRLRTLTQAEIYHSPLDEIADQNLLKYFTQLAVEPVERDTQVEIEHRMISCRAQCDGVALFDFSALCETARSQTDYMEISRIYHSVLLSNVKQMGQSNDDAARRFLALVDEFYERNVKLIISSAVSIEDLYSSGTLEFEFRRCRSRLQEMQSHEYLARPHIP